MELKGHVISPPDPITCPDRKLSQRMAELQERRWSLQGQLRVRLAELRRICLQEAELTGALPRDFPLEPGEKPPCVRRRGGVFCQGHRKCRTEEDNSRSRLKKTLFSGALKKHSDTEHNTHSQTHIYHSKRTVHRGCHTDDSVRSESGSTSDLTGHDNDEILPQCRPPLVTAGSPVEVFHQNKTLRNRSNHLDTVYAHRALPLPPSQPSTLLHHPPPPSPRSQDSSSSGPSDPGASGEGVGRVYGVCRSSSPDVLPSEQKGEQQQGGVWVTSMSGSRGGNTAGVFRSSETLSDGRNRFTNDPSDAGAKEGGAPIWKGRGGGYSDVLLDYVWGKQQQLQREQSQPSTRQSLFNGCSSQHSVGAPPTSCHRHGDQRRVKVTRTKSCGPFLPVQQSQSSTHNPPLSAIQPDPHPHLLPPRPQQLPPNQDAQLEEATRSLHKALALEGLRDWYLRNTIGSTHPNQASGKGKSGVIMKGNAGGGGALQHKQTTLGAIEQSACQTETGQHHGPSPHKLPHSATFHGHSLHARSGDRSLYHDPFHPRNQAAVDQPSPGTLV